MNLRHLVAIVCLWTVGAAPQQTAEQPPKPPPARVIFVKEFPGSFPDYYSVTVNEKGEAVYATAPDDAQPLRFRLSESLTRQLFETVARLNHFRDVQLESRKRVAAMGKKTLRYEAGGQRSEAWFNYTENQDAVALAGLFERISITEQLLLGLERMVRFDRLGVVKQLLQIEIAMNKRELVEPAQFVPLLEDITRDSRFLHMAQERAANLLDRIRNSTSSANLAPGQSR